MAGDYPLPNLASSCLSSHMMVHNQHRISRLFHSDHRSPTVLVSKWQRGHGKTQDESPHQGCEADFVRMAPTRDSINGSHYTMATAPPASLGKCQTYRLPSLSQGVAEVGRGCGVWCEGECHQATLLLKRWARDPQGTKH